MALAWQNKHDRVVLAPRLVHCFTDPAASSFSQLALNAAPAAARSSASPSVVPRQQEAGRAS